MRNKPRKALKNSPPGTRELFHFIRSKKVPSSCKNNAVKLKTTEEIKKI